MSTRARQIRLNTFLLSARSADIRCNKHYFVLSLFTPNKYWLNCTKLDRYRINILSSCGNTLCCIHCSDVPLGSVLKSHCGSPVQGASPTPVLCVGAKCPSTASTVSGGQLAITVAKALGKTGGNGVFSADDLFVLRAICYSVSKSVGLSEVYENARNHDITHKKLIEMIKSVTSQLDPPKLMFAIAGAAAQLLDAQVASC